MHHVEVFFIFHACALVCFHGVHGFPPAIHAVRGRECECTKVFPVSISGVPVHAVQARLNAPLERFCCPNICLTLLDRSFGHHIVLQTETFRMDHTYLFTSLHVCCRSVQIVHVLHVQLSSCTSGNRILLRQAFAHGPDKLSQVGCAVKQAVTIRKIVHNF